MLTCPRIDRYQLFEPGFGDRAYALDCYNILLNMMQFKISQLRIQPGLNRLQKITIPNKELVALVGRSKVFVQLVL